MGQLGPQQQFYQGLQQAFYPQSQRDWIQLMNAHNAAVVRDYELRKAQEDPAWWVEHKMVPPIEPFERFVGWINLELVELKKR
jgi:hypothetical protein